MRKGLSGPLFPGVELNTIIVYHTDSFTLLVFVGSFSHDVGVLHVHGTKSSFRTMPILQVL